MRLNLMIEGQEGVTWDEWVALARTAESVGFEGLFRSDHYLTGRAGGSRSSLDAWAVLAALAAITERIKLGTLVSPITFRHPSVLGKMATTVDHISGGRVELGIGAGWHEPEHEAYGFAFPGTAERFEILAEQIEIIVRQWSEGTFDFSGSHYTLKSCEALPKPVQQPRPNLIVGGSGNRRSAALAARWADEYNTVFPTLEEAASRRRRLEKAWEDSGRDPEGLVFSVMTGCVVGSDASDVRERAQRVMRRGNETGNVDDWIAEKRHRWVIGTIDESISQLRHLETAGVQRIMLQHNDHADLEMVELVGMQVAPALRD
jgi:F420-dependent oxidoreductase-like protein